MIIHKIYEMSMQSIEKKHIALSIQNTSYRQCDMQKNRDFLYIQLQIYN